MHETRPAKITSAIVDLGGIQATLMIPALIVGVIGVAVAFVVNGGPWGFERFSHIYLINFAFVLTMCIGCLFFVTISHLTRAGWNVTIRRIAELYAQCLPVLFILFLPILIPLLFSSNGLYVWNEGGWSMHNDGTEAFQTLKAEVASSEVADRPPLEILKHAYLNKTFFAIRWVIYFCVWGGMATFFLRTSLKQDESGDKKLTGLMQAFSAPAMIAFAVSIVFSSMDLLMSLEPLWFSTMFPVYFFAGSVLSALALITLTSLNLQKAGRVTDEITVEHYHDLGKMMHGFVVFWGYIAFSQFLLIWYANIPEETFWYEYRMSLTDGWGLLSIVLLVGHLFVPFLFMMGRTMRRNKKLMMIAVIWLLVMHWLDLYWLVMPQYSRAGGTIGFGILAILSDLACTVGFIGLFVGLFCLVAGDKPLVTLQDPRLGEALNHAVH